MFDLDDLDFADRALAQIAETSFRGLGLVSRPIRPQAGANAHLGSRAILAASNGAARCPYTTERAA